MLRGLHRLLTPDLLHALASMGHGDTIAVVDANYPATSNAKRLITLAGVDAPSALDAILSVFPVDEMVDEPTSVMAVVGGAETVPPPVRDFIALLAAHGVKAPLPLERFRFYREAQAAYAIVLTGEPRFYGNIILTKGVVAP